MNKQLILFGAGKKGRDIFEFLDFCELTEKIYAFCDSNPNLVGTDIQGKKIISYDDAKKTGLPIVVSVYKEKACDEIAQRLAADNLVFYTDVFRCLQLELGIDATELNRNYCAFRHVETFDRYFAIAETDNNLNVFWSSESPFYKMFRQLDLTNVVELACGRGRHVPYYYKDAGEIVLVDILEKNMEYCKERFKDKNKITYYKNNGFDLSELEDEKYTSLFTYDAMVHFEMFDVYEYLKETYRILCKSGKAIFHHSNMATDYRQTFKNAGNPGGRNFMSKELFAFLAYKAGFEILEQKVIDWTLPEMDCITMVQKK